jgi:RimJ/RimL family protein N-acetyltransferase
VADLLPLIRCGRSAAPTCLRPVSAGSHQYHAELDRYTSPHDWWRVAALPDGDPVGFVIPAHNGYNAIIAYIGVLPAHRGRGHVDEILAEGTRLLAAERVPRIRASTDVGNRPMAAAFARAGYVTFGHRIDMRWGRSAGSPHVRAPGGPAPAPSA